MASSKQLKLFNYLQQKFNANHIFDLITIIIIKTYDLYSNVL